MYSNDILDILDILDIFLILQIIEVDFIMFLRIILSTEKVGGLTPLRIRKTCRTYRAGGWQAAKNLWFLAGFQMPVAGGQRKISH